MPPSPTIRMSPSEPGRSPFMVKSTVPQRWLPDTADWHRSPSPAPLNTSSRSRLPSRYGSALRPSASTISPDIVAAASRPAGSSLSLASSASCTDCMLWTLSESHTTVVHANGTDFAPFLTDSTDADTVRQPSAPVAAS